MKLIERYILRRIVNATALTFISLGTMVWLSQALRQFNIVTADGQAITTFFEISALLVPVLVVVVFPVALLIAVIYTFSSLNNDAELVVINASGARQGALLKPVLIVGVVSTLIVASMTLHFAPLALRTWQSMITNVRGNIISSFMTDGAFVTLAPKLVFHMRSRNQDGSLRGIFLSDDRDPSKTVTYLGERGAILDNPAGTFLVMGNGTIQERSKIDQSISMIEFSSYAFDLSSFTSAAQLPVLEPIQRPTSYLLHPDAKDPFFINSPRKFRAELDDRLTSPLYCMIFALVPLLFLGQAQSTRQSRAPSITAAVLLTVAIRVVPVFLPTATSTVAEVIAYVVPLLLTVVTVALFLGGVQLRPPESIVAFLERVSAGASGLFTRRAATAQTR
jgi:lipopolysaccharide export system permease protein